MKQSPTIQVIVVFYSRFGVVKRLAECIAEGVGRVEGADAALFEIEDQPVEEPRPGEGPSEMATRRAALVDRLLSADALIVGAPGYFGGMASPVKRLFEDCATASGPPSTDRTRPWRHFQFHNKVGAAFTATGTPHGGNEQTLHSILTMLMHLGMIVVTPGQQQPIMEDQAAPYGPTAISGPEGRQMPSEAEEETARRLGQRVADIATWLKLGAVRARQVQTARARSRTRGSERPI